MRTLTKRLLQILISVVILLGIVVVAANYWARMSLYPRMIKKLSDESRLNVTITQLQHHFWRSDATLSLAFDHGKQHLSFTESITGGPIIKQNGWHLGWLLVDSHLKQSDLPMKLTLHNQTLVNLAGHISNIIRGDILASKDNPLHIGGFKARSTLTTSSYQYQATANTLQLNGPRNTLSFTQPTMISKKLNDGSNNMQIIRAPKVAVINNMNHRPEITISNLLWSAGSQEKPKNTQTHYVLNIQSIQQANTKPFGIKLDVSLQKLDTATLKQFSLNKIQAMPAKKRLFLMAMGAKTLLNKGLQLNLHNLTYHDATGFMKWHGQITMPPNIEKNIEQNMKHATITLQCVASRGIFLDFISLSFKDNTQKTRAQKANAQLIHWLANGSVKMRDNNILLVLKYQNGKWYFNRHDGFLLPAHMPGTHAATNAPKQAKK